MAVAVTVTEAWWPRRTRGWLRARWGLKFGTSYRGQRTRWRRDGEGGSFISLPHGIIYREDFRESTQRAPAIEEEAGRRCVERREDRKRVCSEGKGGKRVPPSLPLMLAAGGIKEPM